MVLSYLRLVTFLGDGTVKNASYDAVNGSSIDLTLGNVFLREIANPAIAEDELTIVKLSTRDSMYTERIELAEGEPFHLFPGEFVLAHTREEFNLPLNISAEYKLKSSLARAGLNHALAGWCDPGWRGILTLELHNATQFHIIELTPGDRIGQMVFMEHDQVPPSRSYKARGAYQDVFEVSGPLTLQKE